MVRADRLDMAIPGIGETPLIGIIRGLPLDRVTDIALAAARAGMLVLEVTLDSEDPLAQIEALTGTSDITVGAGTVTRPEQVGNAVAAGARFVVSPICSSAVIARCVDLDVPVLAGAATPTEIVTALEAGATAVKVFPAAQLGGPAFIKAIRSPLGLPPLVPTGGVTLEDVTDYMNAGARAVGVGSGLFSGQLAASSPGEMTRRISGWVRKVTS